MFSYLNGTVSHKTDRFAVVDVGGVGFKVFLTTRNLQKLEVGEPKKVFTYLRVAEDILDLYGFLDAEELEMFELLISVNGIGAKAAMSILSTLPANELAIAIVTGDAKAVSKAQGVGGKTAQRLILELKDKIKTSPLWPVRPTLTSRLLQGPWTRPLAPWWFWAIRFPRRKRRCPRPIRTSFRRGLD